MAHVVKNLSAGKENDNPLQSSCLENSMDRGAWRTTIHRVAKSRTQLKQLGMHTLGGKGLLTLSLPSDSTDLGG